MLSSITHVARSGFPPRGETMVTQMRLSRIKVPVFVAAHAQDNDITTAPAGAKTIAKRVKNAPAIEVKIYSEGPDVKPYGGGRGLVPHTFAGKRTELAKDIAKFILSNTRTR